MSVKTALVTGAAAGIGAACAKRLAKDGMAVGVLDLDAERCADTVAAIKAAGGMAAMSAVMLSYLSAGDHMVAGRALFGPCRWVIDNLLPRFGITASVVDGRDNAAWEAACRASSIPASPAILSMISRCSR